jgi:ABC-type transport system involved in multi-copper enzyme maturation permease subunit
MSVAAWLTETRNVYVGNATSTRDFRLQLRGSRSAWLFAVYLGLLITVGMIVYWQTAGDSNITVVDAQRRLHDFYQIVMALLGGMIAMVSPALTATSVVMERQRKSLDLIFSAPVSAKQFLVGKMLSSYRYTWMMLVLALPVTSACVVLGGASWTDVLVAYALLSMQGLVFTSMGLLISTLSQKPVAAVIWSYTLASVYVIFTAPFGAMGSFGSRSREANFLGGLSPFFTPGAADTYTAVGSWQIPNWILASIVALLLCKVTLLAAGSLLSPAGAKEVPSLRAHTLGYGFLIFLYASYSFSGSFVPGFSLGRSGPDPQFELPILEFWMLMPLAIFMPLLACFGMDAEKRFRPDGVFRFRQMLRGTPSGALPFVLTLIAVSTAGVLLGAYEGAHFVPQFSFWIGILFSLGFWVFFWAVARWTSARFLGLKAARTLQFTVFIVVVLLPIPFLSAIMSSAGIGWDPNSPLLDLYVLRPIAQIDSGRVGQEALYGGILLVLGIVISVWSEKRIASKLATLGDSNERTLTAA